jgi:intracellular proteinase inhibitor BsuPI
VLITSLTVGCVSGGPLTTAAEAPIGLWMNARNLLIPLLCIGAVAFACGPRSHSEASLVTTNIAKAATGPAHRSLRKQAGQNVTHVTGTLAVNAQKSSIHFAFDLTNDGKKNVELTFPDGQRYDFVVIDSAGRQVYRWADGRMFTQSVQNASLDGGDTMHITEQAATSLPQGSYVAVATLRSSNFPVQERVAFELR